MQVAGVTKERRYRRSFCRSRLVPVTGQRLTRTKAKLEHGRN